MQQFLLITQKQDPNCDLKSLLFLLMCTLVIGLPYASDPILYNSNHGLFLTNIFHVFLLIINIRLMFFQFICWLSLSCCYTAFDRNYTLENQTVIFNFLLLLMWKAKIVAFEKTLLLLPFLQLKKNNNTHFSLKLTTCVDPLS